MNGMPGVTRVRSVSGVGLSLGMWSSTGATSGASRQSVTRRLAAVRERLPPGWCRRWADRLDHGRVLLIALPIDPAQASPLAVREYADWVLRPRLLAVPGVAQVIPIGGGVRSGG